MVAHNSGSLLSAGYGGVESPNRKYDEESKRVGTGDEQLYYFTALKEISVGHVQT